MPIKGTLWNGLCLFIGLLVTWTGGMRISEGHMYLGVLSILLGAGLITITVIIIKKQKERADANKR